VERRSLGLTIDVELKECKVDMIASTDHPMLHSFAEQTSPFGHLRRVMDIIQKDGTSDAYMHSEVVDFGFKHKQ